MSPMYEGVELPDENREVLNTKDMLMEGFLANLQGSPDPAASEAAMHIASTLNEPPAPGSDLFTAPKQVLTANSEKLLTDLYGVRDELIEVFENIDHKRVAIANSLTRNIHVVNQCIVHLGGAGQNFNPLDHISGLKEPNLLKNAERVIEMTKNCYKGQISDIHLKEDDPNTIIATFSGRDGDMMYEAVGTVTANSSWVGNEALDYIYTPGSGRMSVKAFSSGKWSDRSSEEDYAIYWDLREGPYTESSSDDQKKEGAAGNIENNISGRDESLNFPIEEK